MSYGFLSSLKWRLNITQTGCWSDVERTPQFKSEALGLSPNTVTTQCVTQGKAPVAGNLSLPRLEVDAPA